MSMKNTKLRDLDEADYNPREIEEKALAGLAASVREFGDLSGFTYNLQTGRLIAAHQRRKVLLGMGDPEVQWGEPYETDHGTEQDGWMTISDGRRFRVRGVHWDEGKEKAANVAANSTELQGRFTSGLDELLRGLSEIPEVPFDELRFDLLLGEAGSVDWAQAFEDGGDTSGVDDRKQVTFVLSTEDHTRLMKHLAQYGNKKNVAIVSWLDEVGT